MQKKIKREDEKQRLANRKEPPLHVQLQRLEKKNVKEEGGRRREEGGRRKE